MNNISNDITMSEPDHEIVFTKPESRKKKTNLLHTFNTPNVAEMTPPQSLLFPPHILPFNLPLMHPIEIIPSAKQIPSTLNEWLFLEQSPSFNPLDYFASFVVQKEAIPNGAIVHCNVEKDIHSTVMSNSSKKIVKHFKKSKNKEKENFNAIYFGRNVVKALQLAIKQITDINIQTLLHIDIYSLDIVEKGNPIRDLLLNSVYNGKVERLFNTCLYQPLFNNYDIVGHKYLTNNFIINLKNLASSFEQKNFHKLIILKMEKIIDDVMNKRFVIFFLIKYKL
jgi:hypothetical protein